MSDGYISDPALLEILNAKGAPAAPAAGGNSSANSSPAQGGAYITDPALLEALSKAPVASVQAASEARAAERQPAALPEEWFQGENAVRAFSRNALNTLTFGAARNAVSAIQHYVGGKGESFEDQYQRNYAQDRALAAAHPVAGALGTGVGAVQAMALAPAVLPEAGMAALYGGGLAAAGRSAAIGGGLAGVGTLAETHDPKQAAGAALAGAVAGPVADRALGALAPLLSPATKLTSREAKLLTPKPGTPAAFRDALGTLGAQAAGAAVGGVAGAGVGNLLPVEYGGHGGAAAGAYGGREAVKAMQDRRAAIQSQRLYYPRTDRGSAAVGALIPQVVNGLLGP